MDVKVLKQWLSKQHKILSPGFNLAIELVEEKIDELEENNQKWKFRLGEKLLDAIDWNLSPHEMIKRVDCLLAKCQKHYENSDQLELDAQIAAYEHFRYLLDEANYED